MKLLEFGKGSKTLAFLIFHVSCLRLICEKDVSEHCINGMVRSVRVAIALRKSIIFYHVTPGRKIYRNRGLLKML